MKRLLLAILAIGFISMAKAQLLTWTPGFPTETSPITITVDATKGNKGLMDFNGNVYVHVGAITNLSTGPSNWLHAPFAWGSTEAAALATPDGPNKWKFTISNPRTFFNLAANEELKYIAILFRKGGCTDCAAQRNTDGSDMYVPIYKNDFAVRIDLPASEPKYVRNAEPQNWTVGSNFTIKGVANRTSDMRIRHNGNVIATATGVQSITGNSSVTAIGNQQIIVDATENGVTKYDTMNIFVSPASAPVAALPAGLRDGINYSADYSKATLVLHAPDKKIVTVIGEFNNWTESTDYIMNKTPDGKKFWLTLTGLSSSQEYAFQYKVDDTIRIADPYAEKILDPWNDQYIPATTYPNIKPYPTGKTSGIVGILQTAATSYGWSTNDYVRPKKEGLIIYELLLRDFLDKHDWKTLEDTINYLQNLGVNAIEIMPFNEFEGNLSWGYNPDFYFAPDKYYGPPMSLKHFINFCHSKGIAVIMDIALNHSFGLSPMVQLYWDAARNRPAENNPWFNPVPKHAFNVGFDMNHESLDTRYFTSRVIEYWTKEYRIDGFRFDLSKGFTQTQTCDNNGANCNEGNMGNYDASRVAIWKRYYDTTQLKAPGSYVILEHFAANNEEKELADYGMMFWGNLNYNYRRAAAGDIGNSNFEGGIYTSRGWTKPHLITYMESHDEERVMYDALQTGASSGSYNIKDTSTALKRLVLNGAFFFTIPGPKMIWQFGELGYDYPINYCTNGTVNNNCRLDNKPIRWDYLQNANRKSVYDAYSKMIKLRNHTWYKDVFTSANAIEKSLGGAFKWMKITTDTSKLLVVGNFGTTQTTNTVTFQNSGTWYDYMENTTFSATGESQNIMLQPGEFHIYVNRNVNNITVTPVSNVPRSENAFDVNVFPNPAQSSFTVKVRVPQAGIVDIELVNAVGQRVTTLHQAFLLKGEHKLPFNKKSINITAGTYYLKVQTKTAAKTVQLTIQ